MGMKRVFPLHWTGRDVKIEGQIYHVRGVSRVGEASRNQYAVSYGKGKKVRGTIRVELRVNPSGDDEVNRIDGKRKREKKPTVLRHV
jgi:hypothetical protein